MSKRIVAKVGSYTKDGQTKGKYTEVGVILSNQNGEFMLLDPGVNVAGLLMQQNILAVQENKAPSERVMCSIFDNNNQNQGQRNNQAPQQPQQQGQQQFQQPNFNNPIGI